MRYTHNSIREIKRIRNIKQDNSHFKPKGLWLSINNEWEEWCEANEYGNYTYSYEFQIDKSNMLLLKNMNDVMKFHDDFKETLYTANINKKSFSLDIINWKKVAEQYSGIEIFPYVKNYDMNFMQTWYYGWDISSACIWNKNVITSFRKI